MTQPIGTASRGSAFGLLFESNIPIPGLGQAHRPGDPDIRVTLGTLPPRLRIPLAGADGYRPAAAEERAEMQATPVEGGLHFRFVDGSEVAVTEGGARLWCDWPPGVSEHDAAIYLLGPVMALLLRWRGLTVIHAAGLVRSGQALAVIGAAGAGKSTTAAALSTRGFQVLTDDVLALDDGPDGSVVALPGPPRVRLWPDASTALFGAADAVPLITPNWTKRFLDVQDRWASGPSALRALYLLYPREGSPAAARLEPMSQAEALMAIVGNTYHPWLTDPSHRARDLARLGRIVRRTHVRRLVPTDGHAFLDDLADLIRADFDAVSQPRD